MPQLTSEENLAQTPFELSNRFLSQYRKERKKETSPIYCVNKGFGVDWLSGIDIGLEMKRSWNRTCVWTITCLTLLPMAPFRLSG